MKELKKSWKELQEPMAEILEILREELNWRLEDLEVYVSVGEPREVSGKDWIGYHMWLMRRKRKIADIYLTLTPNQTWPKETDINLDIVSKRKKKPLYIQIITGTTDWVLARSLRRWKDEYLKDLFAPEIETAVRHQEVRKAPPQDWLPPEE